MLEPLKQLDASLGLCIRIRLLRSLILSACLAVSGTAVALLLLKFETIAR